MNRILKKRKKNEIGLSPDDLTFRGQKKTEDVLLRLIDYDLEHLIEDKLKSVQDIAKFQEKDTITWLNIDGLHNTSIMQDISTSFNLDNLVVAEVLNTDARPRIIEYDNCTLITIKMLKLNEINPEIIVENLSIILTKSVLISFQEQKADVFEPVRERIRKQKKRIRHGGIDYLTFALFRY